VICLSHNDYIRTINIGKIFSTNLEITETLVNQFGLLSGDLNPLHTDNDYAKKKGFLGRVCYGNILGMLISTLVGMRLGFDEVMLISQKINFKQPIYIGDKIELKGEVLNKSESVKIIELGLSFWNENGQKIASGKCQVRCI
jgi:acyl dehydratase